MCLLCITANDQPKFQMRVLQNNILLLLLISCHLGMLGKCIFDEVHDSTHVGSSPLIQPSPFEKVSSGDINHDLNRTLQINPYTKLDRIYKRIKRNGINLVVQHKPIRIKTWTLIESPSHAWKDKDYKKQWMKQSARCPNYSQVPS